MRKVFMAVFILFTVLLCGCSSDGYIITEPDYSAYVPTDDPNYETDYSNITVTILKEIYTSDDDRASCDVTDNNPGKMFYICTLTYIERFDGKDWINIPYKNKSIYMQEVGWATCWIEGNYDKPNSTRASVRFDMLSEPMRTGNYRLVVFVGDRKLYAPFEYKE